jgi:hypothetical protein
MSFMPGVANKPIMLSVFMLSVVVLNVVEPKRAHPKPKKTYSIVAV